MNGILTDFRELLFPRCCLVCGSLLTSSEQHICTCCLSRLPRTRFEETPHNILWQHLVGSPVVERVTAWFYYEKENPYTHLIHAAKYGNKPDVGRYMARLASETLVRQGYFEGIDRLVPVPLSFRRQWRRGCNQSSFIAWGIADVTNIPLEEQAVGRKVNNGTQTRHSRDDRWENVQGIFRVKHPELLAGKHVLLVDDVATTCATLMSCIGELEKNVPDVKVSVFTLACAKKS